MADLKTNYVDDVLDTTKNQLRKYQQIQNDDGTVSFVDVTEYTQVGTSFGAKDINDTNAAINDVNGKLSNLIKSNTVTTNTFAVSSGIPLSKPIVSCKCTYTNIALVAFPTNRGGEFWSVDVRNANDLSLNDISTTITVTYLDI